MEKTRKNLDVCICVYHYGTGLIRQPELHYKRMDFGMNKGEVAAYKQDMVRHDEGRDISDSKSSKNMIVVILDTGH